MPVKDKASTDMSLVSLNCVQIWQISHAGHVTKHMVQVENCLFLNLCNEKQNYMF